MGLVSWTVWLFRRLLSVRYQPVVNHYRTTTSVVVPAYREDPEVLERCLRTWYREKPDEIIIVPDVEDAEVIERLERFSLADPRIRVLPFEHRGKRSALGVGIRAARYDVVVLADSDTAWQPGLLAAVQMPFVDPMVGGVGTRQSVYQRDSSVWRRVADWLVGVRYLNYLPAQSRAGYGGSCFPKDVAAFAHRSAELGVDFGILRETARVNLAARQRVLDKVRDALWHLAGKRVGVLGLAFKPETDDLREAPAMDVARGLQAEGAEVIAYDPVAGDQAVELLPEMKLAPEPLDAVEGAHALVVMTGWPELAKLDPVAARERMAYPILVDARNALDAEAFGAAGFTVIGVGRPVRNALTPAGR